MRRIDKIFSKLNFGANKDETPAISPDAHLGTNSSEFPTNGYLEVDINTFDNRDDIPKLQAPCYKSNSCSKNKKSNWFCNRGFSSSETSFSQEKESQNKIFVHDIRIIKPACVDSTNLQKNSSEDSLTIGPTENTIKQDLVSSNKETSFSPEKESQNKIFVHDIRIIKPACVDSTNLQKNSSEDSLTIGLTENTIKQGLVSSNKETSFHQGKENRNKIIMHDMTVKKPACFESTNLHKDLSEDSIAIGNIKNTIKKDHFLRNRAQLNMSSKKVVENVEVPSYTESSPCTPEDIFHTSLSDDSLFCPSSDEDGSSDDDENPTPKKPKKRGINKNFNQTKITIENFDSAPTVESERPDDNDNESIIPTNSSSRNPVASELPYREEKMVDDLNLNLPSTSSCINIIANKTPYKRKPDHCYYCETMVLNFGRHVIRHHSNETDVARILEKPVKSRERKQLFNVLRRKGNFLADGNICFKPVREGYVPDRNKNYCSNCLGYFSSKLLYRHKKECVKRYAVGSQDGHLKMFHNFKVDHRLKEEVFPHMRADKLSMEAQRDPLICEYGARYLKTHRDKHFIHVTSRKMRELSKVLSEMRKLDPSITTFITAFKPKNFDIFVEATKRIAQYDPERDVYLSPTFAMNIVRSLKQCCDIAITLIYTKNMAHSLSAASSEADLKTLIRLFEANWSCEVSSHAANNLNLNKWNKVTIVPLASDLRLLRQHLINLAGVSLGVLIEEVENANNAKSMQVEDTDHQLNIMNSETIQAFNNLMETVYCRVILFNRKRSGELQRMYLHTYLNASTETQKYEEFDNVVSLPEKILLKSLKRVVIRGKRGKGVPVLFHPDIQDHIKKILEVRHHFVSKNNPYLFAMANSNTHLIGYKVLAKHAKLCGAQNPSSITSTRLRKHLATLSQLFNLSDGEIEQLSTFMGHTSGVHRSSYRLPDEVYQTAKISKLLMVMEKGGADHYRGKCIDDIDIDMEENLLSDKDCDDDSDVDENPIIDELIDSSKPSTSSCQDFIPTNEVDGESPVMPKKKKTRKLVPWTDEQKKVTLNYFKNHIKLKKPPKRHECEDLKMKYKQVLGTKDWLKIKVFVQNFYTKGRK